MTFAVSSTHFTSDAWPIPGSIELDGPFISWELGRVSSVTESRDSLLSDFARLADAQPKAIAEFARSAGVLFIRECSLAPREHEHRPETNAACRLRPFDAGLMRRGREPVEMWLDYASRVGAMLRLIEAVRSGEPGSEATWRAVRPHLLRDPDVPVPTTALQAEDELVTQVRWWLWLGDVRPSFDIQHDDEDEPDFRLWLGGDGLFGGLAYALMLRLGHASELVMCSNAADPACERLYRPKRRPRAGERNYCPTCSKNAVPSRDAKRALRAGQERPRRRKGETR